LGINPGHDGTAVLLDEGRVLAAVAEERLTRVKYHTGFPFRAVQECLRIGGVSAGDVEIVAFCFNSTLSGVPYDTEFVLSKHVKNREDHVHSIPAYKRRAMALSPLTRAITPAARFRAERERAGRAAYRTALDEMGLSNAKIKVHDHHLCHSASAVFTAGFDECLVVTADGQGDGLSATASTYRSGNIEQITSSPETASPGWFYSAITHFLGYRRLRHEGKVTGLAAYGNPSTYYQALEQCLSLSADKLKFIGLVGSKADLARYYSRVPWALATDTFHTFTLDLLLEHFKKHLDPRKKEDVAAAAQVLLEDVMVEHVKTLVAQTGLTQVAMAGGILANVRVNQRIAEETGADRVFIHPNMGDGGAAFGAALLSWRQTPQGKNFVGEKLDNVYWGPEYSEKQVAETARKLGLPVEKTPDLESAVAQELADGKVVGWFGGKMEYGPRALGNRSILAAPTDRKINDWLNERLHRTEFMPFAPSVLDKNAADIFKNYEQSKQAASFMTITFNVLDEWIERAPAVCHVDGTARPQVVSARQNPRYYRVIEQFEKKTGLPLIVNTSFNAHEEPIVCTPEDAMRSFAAGSVDSLAIEGFLLTKT